MSDNPYDKIAVLSIEAAIRIAKTCKDKKEIIEQLTKWLEEVKK